MHYGEFWQASAIGRDCCGQIARTTVLNRRCCEAFVSRVDNAFIDCLCKTTEHRAETFVFVLLDEDTKSSKGSILHGRNYMPCWLSDWLLRGHVIWNWRREAEVLQYVFQHFHQHDVELYIAFEIKFFLLHDSYTVETRDNELLRQQNIFGSPANDCP